MKPNLKDLIHNYFSKSHQQTYDELRALIKELKAIIWSCENQPVQGENVKVHLQARIEAFKEVLGE